MRVFIICTPRTGNTWLRHMLGDALGAEHRPVREPGEVPWNDLPDDCVYAVHWPRDPDFAGLLSRHGFRIVVLLRHPLDVLISVLQNAATNSDWVSTGDEGEHPIHFAMPSGAAFAEYAHGPSARAMLSISPDWADHPEARTVRYENLVSDTAGTLQTLLASLGADTSADSQEVAGRHRMGEMQSRTDQFHCWQGVPGLWRRLLTPAVAERLAAPFRDRYARFGYSFEADPSLEPLAAERHWLDLAGGHWSRSLRRFRQMQMEWRNIRQTAEALDAERKCLSEHCKVLTAQVGRLEDERSALVGRLAGCRRVAAKLHAVKCALWPVWLGVKVARRSASAVASAWAATRRALQTGRFSCPNLESELRFKRANGRAGFGDTAGGRSPRLAVSPNAFHPRKGKPVERR